MRPGHVIILLFLAACNILCANFNFEEKNDSDDELTLVPRFITNGPEAVATAVNTEIYAIRVNLAASRPAPPSSSHRPRTTATVAKLRKMRASLRTSISQQLDMPELTEQARTRLVNQVIERTMAIIQETGMLDDSSSIYFQIEIEKQSDTYCCIS